MAKLGPLPARRKTASRLCERRVRARARALPVGDDSEAVPATAVLSVRCGRSGGVGTETGRGDWSPGRCARPSTVLSATVPADVGLGHARPRERVPPGTRCTRRLGAAELWLFVNCGVTSQPGCGQRSGWVAIPAPARVRVARRSSAERLGL